MQSVTHPLDTLQQLPNKTLMEIAMLNRIPLLLLFSAFALFVSGCGGGAGVMDVKSSFSTSSDKATLDQVGRKIITASAVKGWKPRLASAGHIIASRRRSGYVAKIDIFYTSDRFEIKYKDSDNMGYDGHSISSVYGDWVSDLSDEIKRRLSEL